MIPGWRGLVAIAAFLGATGVLAAAVGSHLPALTSNPEQMSNWQSANLLHWVHAPAILALGALSNSPGGKGWGLLGLAMALGVLLFSGSLYARALGWIDSAPVAPLGGMLLVVTWLAAACYVLLRKT